MNSLIWLRSDLRTRDNPALRAALEHGPTLALYIIAPSQWREHHDSPGKVDFWRRNLQDLSNTLEHMNVPLKIVRARDWSTAAKHVLQICKQNAVDQVHVNAEWGWNERQRDEAVQRALDDGGIEWHTHHGSTLLEPGTVTTGQGQPYKVFTPYARVCRERLRTAPPSPTGRPRPQADAPRDVEDKKIQRDAVPDHITGYEPPDDAIRAFWPHGEDAANDRLRAFAEDHIADYEQARDIPSEHGTSRLSAYLAAGVLSPLQCLHVALSVNQGELDSGRKGVRTWITELLWREFYIHLMVANPHLSRHQPMQPHTRNVQWREDEQGLAAWQQGRTGIPIVDAAMRQMLAWGWMHNRLRMVSAMFLSKNLLIDWRVGEAWFMQHLVDGELAANNGGWQWSASTGADASPYFRVFNPVTQSERFDSSGTFIRKWLPELAELSDKQIHMPPEAVRAKLNYPQAIVDLRESRQRAIDAFAGIGRKKN